MKITLPRIIIICGHYGSGKTTLAVNMALDYAAQGENVSLCDLDIVNPYFRSADFAKLAEQNSIEMIAPSTAGTNVDVPAINPRLDGALRDVSRRVIVDVGGDDAGAAALGRYAPLLKSRDDWEMLYVINRSRPLIESPQQAVDILREIEYAGRLAATGIVNNTHLSQFTGTEIVQESAEYTSEVSRITGLPIRFTSAREDIAPQIIGTGSVYPVKIYVKPPWEE